MFTSSSSSGGSIGIGIWLGFNALLLVLLAVDLGVFHRRDREVSLKDSLVWTVLWTLLALGFNAVIYFWLGPHKALEFFTGYLLERSLSLDNIFVFLLTFSYFRVPIRSQYRVLFWGILGALVLRALYFALAGLMQLFHPLHYGPAAVLTFVGIKMLLADFYEIPIVAALGVVALILAASVAASVRWPRKAELLPTSPASPSQPNRSGNPSRSKEG